VIVRFASSLTRSDQELAAGAGVDSLLTLCLSQLGVSGSGVGCRLTTSAEVRGLNRRFAGLDRATDVLAFPAAPIPGSEFQIPQAEAGYLGDLVISVRYAARQAERAQADPSAELRLLAVHGLLHLLGHDHAGPKPASRMTRETRRLLSVDAAQRGMAAPPVPALQSQE